MSLDIRTAEKTAIELAEAAGNLQMEGLKTGFEYSSKSSTIDLVTDVDRACEDLILGGLKKQFPDHSFLGEEGGLHEGHHATKYRWIIDPLDGTTNYMHRLPIFATSIALFEENEPLLGVVHSAPLGRTYTAVRGEYSRLNGKSLQASSTRELSSALLATGVPYDRASSEENNMNYITRLTPRVRGVRRLGVASLDACMIGEGVYDAYWEVKIFLWDFAAGLLIAREAGARAEYSAVGDGRYNVVMANPKIYPSFLGELRTAGDSFAPRVFSP